MKENACLKYVSATVEIHFAGDTICCARCPLLETYAPKDIVVAMGVLWEDQVIYIFHSRPGSHISQALAGFHMMPACESVIGIALLAAEGDEVLAQRFSAEEVARIAPYLQQQRQLGHVVWPHDDGEVSLAQPIQFGSHKAALAFAGMYDPTPEQTAARLAELITLCDRLTA